MKESRLLIYALIYFNNGKNLLSRLTITSDDFKPNIEFV
jgi:hypothetical protein